MSTAPSARWSGSRRGAWFAAMVVVALVVGFGVCAGDDEGPLPFSRAEWDAREQVKDFKAHRCQRMADALLASGQLKGRSRAEVVALLGEPPPTGYFRDWSMVYWLGVERGLFAIDSEWLVLRFGEDGKVTEARLVTD